LPAEALQPLSKRMQSACGPLDLMAHMGTGEFVVMLDAADGADAQQFCLKLHKMLTEKPLLPDANNRDLALIAIGAATCKDGFAEPDDVVLAARQGKEKAKQTGKPCVI
ncbi:MAG: GGDEF domain-containing protein, partial [Terriglobales bacterium]